MKKTFLTGILTLSIISIFAATKRILFIGNSYTYVNDLPLTLKNAAASAGDTVIYDSYAPGGYTFQQHASDANTLNKIMAGNWDYVVLQEQSQRPSFSITQVQAQVFPYAKKLDSLIRHYNPCAETIFYMTWGYKTGDASNCANFPPLCTYQGMDSLIRLRYTMMADSNNAIIAPVGAVRKRLRAVNPGIELYDTDGSHPSPQGTYAAACTFYATVFRKSPLNITYNASLMTQQASDIRSAAKIVAYDSLMYWLVGAYDVQAGFIYTNIGNTFTFTNQSVNAAQYLWDFGDGNTSAAATPSHSYANPGTYTVRLIATSCGQSDTISKTVTNTATDIKDAYKQNVLTVYPNPAKDIITIELEEGNVENITIITLQGRLITPFYKRTGNRLSIDMSAYPNGIYMLRVTTNNKDMMTRLIKE